MGANAFLNALKDPDKLKRMALRYAKTEGFLVWAGFCLFVLVVFLLFSSGEFSFLLTLSSVVSMFSFLMVLREVEGNKSVKGVSSRMMECYSLVLIGRLIAIVPFEGYLPFDKSGDWFYQLCELLSLLMCGFIVFCCRVRLTSTYNPMTDTMPHVFLIVPSLVIACLFHPNLNNYMPSDIAWAFALYLESVTVMPQLFMFMKEGQAQAFTSHFLAAQAVSKLTSFIFWAASFSELQNSTHTYKGFVGTWVVAMQLVQLLVMGDFIYHYIRCISKGIPVSQILVADNV